MAKKKRGGKKGKKLSPEEKKLKAQQLALKAEEARKKKEAAERIRLKGIQEREERYAKENMREIHAEWRKILRASRAKELREEVSQLAKEHEHQVRRKDSIVAALFRELEESEAQHSFSFSKHLQIIDGLIDLHYTRVKCMEDEFQERLNILSTDFNNEKSEILMHHDKQTKMLNDMMATMEAQFQEHESELRQEYEANREELKNKNSEEYNVLKLSLENAIEDLERRLELSHQVYLSSTDAKTQAFKKMIDKDKVTARLIEQRMRKLIFLHDSISYWRAKIATNSREWDGINKALRDQKDYVNRHYQSLKRKLLKFRNSEHDKLKEISKINEEVRTELSGILKRSERIIRFGNVNRKLETEHEKIFPFDPLHCNPVLMAGLLPDEDGLVAGTEKKEQKRSVHIADKPRIMFGGKSKEAVVTYRISSYATDKITGEEIEEWNYLSRFQKRYNKVLLDKMALDLEKRRIIIENMRLQSAVQQYLDGCTVNQNVLRGPINTLLIVNRCAKVRA